MSQGAAAGGWRVPCHHPGKAKGGVSTYHPKCSREVTSLVRGVIGAWQRVNPFCRGMRGESPFNPTGTPLHLWGLLYSCYITKS